MHFERALFEKSACCKYFWRVIIFPKERSRPAYQHYYRYRFFCISLTGICLQESTGLRVRAVGPSQVERWSQNMWQCLTQVLVPDLQRTRKAILANSPRACFVSSLFLSSRSCEELTGQKSPRNAKVIGTSTQEHLLEVISTGYHPAVGLL